MGELENHVYSSRIANESMAYHHRDGRPTILVVGGMQQDGYKSEWSFWMPGFFKGLVDCFLGSI